MKKLLVLTAVLLFGTASVFAQWDCDVTWTYDQDDNCQPKNLPSQGTYIIRITLNIYDVANSEQVTAPNPVNTEAITELDTNFGEAQCQVMDYCDDDPYNQPSFTVTALVEFVSTTTQETFCYATGQITGITCTQFYNTVEVPVEFD